MSILRRHIVPTQTRGVSFNSLGEILLDKPTDDTVAGGTALQLVLSHGVRQHSHQTVIEEFASNCASVPSAQRSEPSYCARILCD